jgi:hypothetical protein
MLALSLQEGHAVLLPPMVIKTQKLPRPAVKTTVGDRSYHWIFNAFDGSLLLPHCLESILLLGLTTTFSDEL